MFHLKESPKPSAHEKCHFVMLENIPYDFILFKIFLFVLFLCLLLLCFSRIMSWNCLFYESKSLQNFKGYVSIFWILCVQKENNKNRNEIVLYFIYNRTFQYSDMSLIYLFTNIFIHFVQVWKSGFCIDWMFLYGNWLVPSQMYQPAFIPIICK